MAKVQHTIKLAGCKSDNTVAKTHEAFQVVSFMHPNFKVNTYEMGYAMVETAKGSYKLDLHNSIENLYTGFCNGVKCHFSKKKIVGKLIYWS